jgi:hypothetical protein
MATRKKTKTTTKNGAATIRTITAADLVARERQSYDVPGLLPDGALARIYVRQLTASEVLALRDRSTDFSGENAIAWLISESVVDEHGKPILSEEQARKLSAKAFRALTPIVTEVNSIFGSTAAGAEGNG